MTFFSSQTNKDFDGLTGFGFESSMSYGGGYDGLSMIGPHSLSCFDDDINHGLTLQNEQDNDPHIDTNGIPQLPPLINPDDSTTASSSSNSNNSNISKSTLSDITPSSNSHSLFPFPSNQNHLNNVITSTISSIPIHKNSNTTNISPGSTASTSSLQQIHVHPKIEPNAALLSFSNINKKNNVHNLRNLNMQQIQHQTNFYNNSNNNNLDNFGSFPSRMAMPNRSTVKTEAVHDKQRRDAILREFMNGYNQNEQNKTNQTEVNNNLNNWTLQTLGQQFNHNAPIQNNNISTNNNNQFNYQSSVVPPSYTNSATNGLSQTIPPIPPQTTSNTASLPPLPQNYSISNYPPSDYYHQMSTLRRMSRHNNTPSMPNTATPSTQKKYQCTPIPPLSASTQKKYQCNQCPKKFKHLSNLKIHSIVHTPAALVCSYCNKKFARKTNLKQHERVHTGERPFECKTCKRKFKQKHSLKDHIKIHTGEKPFVCQFCNKSFKIKHNLTLHIRTHTGEKPHACSICCERFYTIKDLKVHQYECPGRVANILPSLHAAMPAQW